MARDAQLTREDEQWYVYYLRHRHSGYARTRPLVKTRLGATLLRWMYEQHLTHREAVAALGISEAALQRYLSSGLRPSTRTLDRMHRVMGISSDELLYLAALCPPYARGPVGPAGAAGAGSREGAASAGSGERPPVQAAGAPPRAWVPVPLDAWDALAQRVARLLAERPAERRAVLAEIEGLRAGALRPAARVVPAPPAEGMAPQATYPSQEWAHERSGERTRP